MAINNDRTRILGDINPRPGTREREMPESERDGSENEESMVGGSRHDRSEHAGSRDVTEGVTGGTGNYRTGTGVTGGDIGNRPE